MGTSLADLHRTSIFKHSPPRPWSHRGAPIGTGSVVRRNTGLALMIVVGLVANVGSYWFSDRIALRLHRLDR